MTYKGDNDRTADRQAYRDGWEAAYLKECHYPEGASISPEGELGTCASYNPESGKCHNVKGCHIDGDTE